MNASAIRLEDAHVLIVDDHPDLIENLSEILEDEGATVSKAMSASQAVEVARHGFDVALVDIRLPDATGLTLLPLLKQASDGLTEVLLITGNGSLDDAIAAVGQDAYAYVLKPFDPADLLSTVGRAVEKVRLQRATREYERRARIAEKLAAVGTLSAGLAHEIRNPLNAASLQLQLLERRIRRIVGEGSTDGTRLLEPVGLVQVEINRLSHLVEDFLRFARPADLHRRRFDLGHLIDHVVELQALEARRHGIELRGDVPPDPLHVDGDRDKLQQVVLNIVRNSIEALEDSGGEIVISLERIDEGMVRLRVRDDGPGVPEEIRTRIFEPFFSTKPMGTGLGMAICHSLIQQHGGDIEVFVENGTVVELRLPAAH
jgi:two-component system sensor histidine kinase HydH